MNQKNEKVAAVKRRVNTSKAWKKEKKEKIRVDHNQCGERIQYNQLTTHQSP
jgi:hypothetical protein